MADAHDSNVVCPRSRTLPTVILGLSLLLGGCVSGPTYSTLFAMSDVGGIPTLNAPWSAGRVMGPGCHNGGALTLMNQYWTTGPVSGVTVLPSNLEPHVVRNHGSAAYADPFEGWTIPSHVISMRPGPNGECAVLRLTVPAAAAGYYSIASSFSGAYASNSVGQGDGVQGMVLHNGTPIGNIVDTQRGPGIWELPRVRLCAGSQIDFAVQMKSNTTDDNTIVYGGLTRVGNLRRGDCLSAGSPVLQDPIGPRSQSGG